MDYVKYFVVENLKINPYFGAIMVLVAIFVIPPLIEIGKFSDKAAQIINNFSY